MPDHASFEFHSQALPPDSFEVISLAGEEGLSRCYEFHINLATKREKIELTAVLASPAKLVIRQGRDDTVFHGFVLDIDQTNRFGEYTFYQAVLAPRLHWLQLTHHNQVFLGMTIPQVMEETLVDGGLTRMDFEFRLHENHDLYQPREMICQYNQTHFEFFSFWTESLGLYYYFEQGPDREKLIVTDNRSVHSPLRGDGEMTYTTPSGLDHAHGREAVYFFRRKQRKVPHALRMKDYDYEHPGLDLTVETPVTDHGFGTVHLYGDPVHYVDPRTGEQLARIRAGELSCRETVCRGKAFTAHVRPGYLFDLRGHYQDDFNRKYLTTDVEHVGNQTRYLTGGLQRAIDEEQGRHANLLALTLKKVHLGADEALSYQNEFTALPDDVQFRPERRTPPSRIWGTLHAVIDGAGSGQYAEIDGEGRYKVILPFDTAGRSGMKASTWIRQAQPFGGAVQGMHFPLRKGVEVLLSFMAGDPNRPVIVGAVPNADNPSVVNESNATMGGFQSERGNQFSMEDTEGSERIVMKSGDGSSVFKMGLSSPDAETLIKAGSFSSFADGVSSESVGVYKSLSSLGGSSTVVGSAKSRAVAEIITSIVAKLPNLAIKATQDGLEIPAEGMKDAKEGPQKTAHDALTIASASIGLASALILPFINLLIAKYVKKGFMSAATKKYKYQKDTKGMITDDKYKSNYSYAVLHEQDAFDDVVMVDMKSKFFSPANATNPPKNMVFYEGKGSQIFYADEDFDVTADNDVTMTANHYIVQRGNRFFRADARKVKAAASDGLTLEVGVPLINLSNTGTDDDYDAVENGINIIAAGTKDININQAPANTRGKINLSSQSEIKSEVDQNHCLLNQTKAETKVGKSHILTKTDTVEIKAGELIESSILLNDDQIKLSYEGLAGAGLYLEEDEAVLAGGNSELKLTSLSATINGKSIKLG